MMDLLELFTLDQRQNINLPFARREVTPQLVRIISNTEPTWASILYSHLDEHSADAAIAAEIDYFQTLGVSFEWKVYEGDSPSDLKTRLARQGFQTAEAEALAILELQNAHWLTPPALEIRKITTLEALVDVQNVQKAVWGGDDLIPRLSRYLAEKPEAMSIYVAYEQGLPAAAAWAEFYENSPFVGFWGGATRAEHRGKGLYRSLVAVRVAESIARGYQFAYVDASPMSRPILERLGFRVLTHSYPYFFEVSKEPDER